MTITAKLISENGQVQLSDRNGETNGPGQIQADLEQIKPCKARQADWLKNFDNEQEDINTRIERAIAINDVLPDKLKVDLSELEAVNTEKKGLFSKLVSLFK